MVREAPMVRGSFNGSLSERWGYILLSCKAESSVGGSLLLQLRIKSYELKIEKLHSFS
jgi:hypothetical protein